MYNKTRCTPVYSLSLLLYLYNKTLSRTHKLRLQKQLLHEESSVLSITPELRSYLLVPWVPGLMTVVLRVSRGRTDTMRYKNSRNMQAETDGDRRE